MAPTVLRVTCALGTLALLAFLFLIGLELATCAAATPNAPS
ncbi:MAG TPA: hypothetical protein VI248_10570 [Kineosporiaceae bacterium]